MNTDSFVRPANAESSANGPHREGDRQTNSAAWLAESSPYLPADLLDLLLANSPDPIYFKDRQSRFVCYSQAFSRYHRLQTPDGLKGKTDFDVFSEEHARQAFEDEQHIIRTGEAVVGKLERETHNDGGVTWALTTKLPWRDRSGTIIGTFGISKDVTLLKEAEARLAHERELFHALVEHLPDAIYFKDHESRFIKLSRSKVERARKFLLQRHRAANGPNQTEQLAPHLLDAGACEQFLVGKTDFELMDPADAQRSIEQERQIMASGNPMIGQLESKNEDGKTIWLLTTKMPWHDKDGNIIGTFGLTREVTEIKEAELKLEESHRRLSHLARMAGMAEVATDILHNVGNVLNSVNVSCCVLSERLQVAPAANLARIPEILRQQAGRIDDFLTNDPKGKKIPAYLETLAAAIEEQRTFAVTELDQLRKNINHIKQIVVMQQDYAKVAGVEESVEVTELIDDALRLNASALDRHQVQIKRDIEPVPPLLVDKHKALQILVNLVSNAKYATSAAERPDKVVTIRVRAAAPNRIQIQVMDNGVGIAPEHLNRIFNHGFTTRRDGHGFGLHSGAITAQDLGGSLTVSSDGLGTGATFTLELPFHREKPGIKT